MKKLIAILLVVLPHILFAQFVYTPNGFKSMEDSSRDYVIIDIPNSNSKDNFKQIKTIFSKEIFNTKAVNVDDSTFVFGLQDAINLQGVKPLTDMFYTVSISCRNSKIKVQFNCRYFQSWHGVLGGGMTVTGAELIYKKGKIKNENAKIEAEKFANSFVDNLKNKLEKSEESW